MSDFGHRCHAFPKNIDRFFHRCRYDRLYLLLWTISKHFIRSLYSFMRNRANLIFKTLLVGLSMMRPGDKLFTTPTWRSWFYNQYQQFSFTVGTL